jgi:hypothetical protein
VNAAFHLVVIDDLHSANIALILANIPCLLVLMTYAMVAVDQ